MSKQTGQLTKHFNLSEFACHDGTGYIEGLRREQGLSKWRANRRARGLARRLERVRKDLGNKPLHLNSVFRTISYNASIGGAKNSAHTRGCAADMRPPEGVSLIELRSSVRKHFDGGVGYYPASNFVHGDFDRQLGRREWYG